MKILFLTILFLSTTAFAAVLSYNERELSLVCVAIPESVLGHENLFIGHEVLRFTESKSTGEIKLFLCAPRRETRGFSG